MIFPEYSNLDDNAITHQTPIPLQEQMPRIKYETRAEVIRTADSIEQRLTTLIDTRLVEMRSHPSRKHPDVKHLIMEDIQKERAYYAMKLDEIEMKMT